MNILNKLFLAATVMSTLFMVSCSDSSEDLTPSEPESNPFQVDPSRTDEEALIRRDFYDKTGIYLLFTDTLIHSDGTVEMVDFNWNYSSYSSDDYRFSYISNIREKQIAADVIRRYFIPYIKEGKLKPFSVLALNTAEVYDWNRSEWQYEWMEHSYISNWRCFAVSAKNWYDMDAEGQKEAGRALLKDFISSKLTKDSPEMSEFMSISKEFYYGDLDEDWFEDEDMTVLYSMGFLSYDDFWESCPDTTTDFNDFKDLALNYTEDEVNEMYGNYALIMQKYHLFLKAIADMGINLNAEIE